MAQSGSAPRPHRVRMRRPTISYAQGTKKHHKPRRNATTAAPAANAVSNSTTSAAPAKNKTAEVVYKPAGL